MGKSILLVDDVRMFLEIEKEFLQHSPVKISTAQNGVEALKVVASQRPDLVFMDLEMPEMNGVDCCRAIKSMTSTATIPVVMITSRGDDASRAHCKSAGCDDFLTKPLERKQFLEIASRYVAGIERREYRLPVNLQGAFQARNMNYVCTLSDLSSGGAFIKSDFHCEIDRIVQLAFTLPNGATVKCQGRVAWFRKGSEKGQLGFGVNFVLLPRETRELIADYISSVPVLR